MSNFLERGVAVEEALTCSGLMCFVVVQILWQQPAWLAQIFPELAVAQGPCR